MGSDYDLHENEKWGYYADDDTDGTPLSREFDQNYTQLPTPLSTIYSSWFRLISTILGIPFAKIPLAKIPLPAKASLAVPYHLATTCFYLTIGALGYAIIEFAINPLAPTAYTAITTAATLLTTTITNNAILATTAAVFLVYSTSVFLAQPDDWYRHGTMVSGETVYEKYLPSPRLAVALQYLLFYTILGTYLASTGVTGWRTILFTVIGWFLFLVTLGVIVIIPNNVFAIPIATIGFIALAYYAPLTFSATGYLATAALTLHSIQRGAIFDPLISDERSDSIPFYPHTRWYVLTQGMYLAGFTLLLADGPTQVLLACFAIATVTTLVIFPLYRSRVANRSTQATKHDYYSENSSFTSLSEQTFGGVNDLSDKFRSDLEDGKQQLQENLTPATAVDSVDDERLDDLYWQYNEFREEYNKHSTETTAVEFDDVKTLNKSEFEELRDRLLSIEDRTDISPHVIHSAERLREGLEQILDDWA